MDGQLTFLGTGTSMGVPTLGCACAVCTSADPHDRRLRPSALIRWSEPDNDAESKTVAEHTVVIDTGPDFREQALRTGLTRVDAVLYTHSHADHILGLDDLRPLSFAAFRAGGPIPLYATAETTAVSSTSSPTRFPRRPPIPTAPVCAWSRSGSATPSTASTFSACLFSMARWRSSAIALVRRPTSPM